MPRKMVDGVTIKVKKYCYCGKLLEGKRSRYCSASCYSSYRKIKERLHYLKYNPPLPQISCIACKIKFTPKRVNQTCCGKLCRKEITTRQMAAKRKANPNKVKSSVHYKQFFVRQTYKGRNEVQALADGVTDISSSGYANEINNFLANGGKVKILADQLDGRVPGVGSTNFLRVSGVGSLTEGVDVSGDWDIQTLSGFGYELHVMDNSNNDQD